MDYRAVLAIGLPIGLGMVGFGSAIALGKAVAAAMEATGRQPEAATKIDRNMLPAASSSNWPFLANFLDLLDKHSTKKKIHHCHHEDNGIAKVGYILNLANALKVIKKESCYRRRNHLWENQGNVPDPHIFSIVIHGWEYVRCQGPIHTFVRTIAQAKDDAH